MRRFSPAVAAAARGVQAGCAGQGHTRAWMVTRTPDGLDGHHFCPRVLTALLQWDTRTVRTVDKKDTKQ